MTKLAEQLAPLDTPERRLYRLAVDLVRDRGPIGARVALRAAVQREPALMDALVVHYCAGIARDMAGPGAEESSRGGLTRHADSGQATRAALGGAVGNEGGQRTLAAPAAYPQLPPSSPPHDSGVASLHVSCDQAAPAAPLSPNACEGANEIVPDGQQCDAPSQAPSAAGGAVTPLPQGRPFSASPAAPRRDGAGQSHPACTPGRSHLARPVAPNPSRGLAAIALAQNPADRALFDSYKVRGGRAIGDLTLGEARTIAATNEREARVLRELVSKIGFNPNPGAPLRDIIRPEWLRAALARNEESTDVCA